MWWTVVLQLDEARKRLLGSAVDIVDLLEELSHRVAARSVAPFLKVGTIPHESLPLVRGAELLASLLSRLPRLLVKQVCLAVRWIGGLEVQLHMRCVLCSFLDSAICRGKKKSSLDVFHVDVAVLISGSEFQCVAVP